MAVRRHFLVTAGSTHERIDEVRMWSNIFTGKTGLDIALALLDLGDVTLLTSNAAHAEAYDGYYGKAGMLGIETFVTHVDLRALLAERVPGQAIDGVFMTAAVSDYAPAGAFKVVERRKEVGEKVGREVWVVEDVQAEKVKSNHGTIALLGVATEKLVDLFRREWGFAGLLVKFKLEAGITEESLVAVARESRLASGADYIVANTLEMVRGPRPGAYVMGAQLCERVERASLAGRLVELMRERFSV